MTSVLNQIYFNNIIASGDVNLELLESLIGKLKIFMVKVLKRLVRHFLWIHLTTTKLVTQQFPEV